MRSLLLRTLRVLTRALIVAHSSSGGTLLLRPEKIPSQEENTKVLKNLEAVDFGIYAAGNFFVRMRRANVDHYYES